MVEIVSRDRGASGAFMQEKYGDKKYDDLTRGTLWMIQDAYAQGHADGHEAVAHLMARVGEVKALLKAALPYVRRDAKTNVDADAHVDLLVDQMLRMVSDWDEENE